MSGPDRQPEDNEARCPGCGEIFPKEGYYWSIAPRMVNGKRVCCTGCVARIEAAANVKDFDGQTFDPNKDGARLNAQLIDVVTYTLDGKWRTLRQISTGTGHPEASVSARLRDLRKPKYQREISARFGPLEVERERVSGGGTCRYRVLSRGVPHGG